MSTPKRQRLSASRVSLSARKSLQGSASALPRPTNNVCCDAPEAGKLANADQLATSRLASTQPSYDFLSGGVTDTPSQPLKRSTSLRQPSILRHDNVNDENLRARINALEYELKDLQGARTAAKLQHEKEIRDVQAKADADFKKYQSANSASNNATTKYDTLAKELRDVKDLRVNEKATLDKQVRDLGERNGSLQEDISDLQAQLADQERQLGRQLKDVEAARLSLQQTLDNLRQELDRISQEHDAAQSRLAKRDVEVVNLETEVTELKSHTGDSEALAVVQRELSDQVTHIRKLETTNREQLSELRRLRDGQRSVQVIEEQKRGLETQLEVMKDVHRQLGEAQIQKEILEDEKRVWASLLEDEGQGVTADSPEAVVKALIQERIEHASILSQLGTTQTEIAEKDELIKSLESKTAELETQIQKSKSVSDADHAPDGKAYKRMDRQRMLAVKEVEYLRAQLKTFDSEETQLMENKNFDTQRTEQIQSLEALVDQYRSEIQTLNNQLTTQETSPTPQAQNTSPRGTKRRAESQDPDLDPATAETTSSQLGPLLRKNKNLQIALQKTTSQSQLLATELQATKSQLKSLRAASKTRILQLSSNPTSDAEAIKLSTLTTLKAENAALLSQLRGSAANQLEEEVKLIPAATYDALALSLTASETVVAERDKRMRRQREIWTEKAAEFRDAIASLLGYRVQFLPNGKVKISSLYYGKPKKVRKGGEDGEDGSDDEDGQDEENFIMFDGDKGTMKVGVGAGGGKFATDVKDLVEFWVKGKKEIPCFLAAMTLEFWERFRSDPGVDRS